MLGKDVAGWLGEAGGATMRADDYQHRFLDFCISRELVDKKNPDVLLIFHDQGLFALFGVPILRSAQLIETSLSQNLVSEVSNRRGLLTNR